MAYDMRKIKLAGALTWALGFCAKITTTIVERK